MGEHVPENAGQPMTMVEPHYSLKDAARMSSQAET